MTFHVDIVDSTVGVDALVLVVENGTRYLTAEELRAIAPRIQAYLNGEGHGNE